MPRFFILLVCLAACGSAEPVYLVGGSDEGSSSGGDLTSTSGVDDESESAGSEEGTGSTSDTGESTSGTEDTGSTSDTGESTETSGTEDTGSTSDTGESTETGVEPDMGGGYVPECGNGILDQGEECDGNELDEAVCTDFANAATFKFTGGTLGCADDCTFDTDACEFCGGLWTGDTDCGDECIPGDVFIFSQPIEPYVDLRCVGKSFGVWWTPTYGGNTITSLTPIDSIEFVYNAFLIRETTNLISVGDFSSLVVGTGQFEVKNNAALCDQQADLLLDWIEANGYLGASEISGNGC
jgi:hypothetical protein